MFVRITLLAGALMVAMSGTAAAGGEPYQSPIKEQCNEEILKDAAWYRELGLMFANQQQLAPAKYQEWGKQIGLDLRKYQAAVESPGASYFVIGPESQFQSLEDYLKSVEDPNAEVVRLYPRDFWLVTDPH